MENKHLNFKYSESLPIRFNFVYICVFPFKLSAIVSHQSRIPFPTAAFLHSRNIQTKSFFMIGTDISNSPFKNLSERKKVYLQ
jgi:hypothetical protein